MSVTNIWVGGVTETTAIIKAKVSGSSVRIGVSEVGVPGVQYYGPETPTANDIVTVEITGLQPLTQYTYFVEEDGVPDNTYPGRFKTFPIPGSVSSFSYGMATCAAGHTAPGTGSVLASNRISNSTVFTTIQQQLEARENGLVFVHGGDMHYYDLGSGSHGIAGGGSAANFRRAYDDVLLQPNQHSLYRNIPLAYVWDDHDYGPNNSDGTAAGRDNACSVYRERVPSYTLPEVSSTGSIYHSFQVGRVLFILSDVRSERSPNSDPQSSSKTMLGSAQKAWMESVLTADNGAEALVWVTPSQWIANDDSWSIFVHEKNEMMQLFGDTGWLNRMICNSGDAHALSIDTGASNTYGYFPIYQFSSLDSSPSSGPETDTGPNLPGNGQYGIVDIFDNGHTIAMKGTGYNFTTPWRSHTFYADIGNAPMYLDYSAGRISPPFEPVDDDQRIVNDVTATRMEGGSARHEVTEGPLSTNPPPTGVGRYDASVDLNVESDTQLPGHAGWMTHLGTVDEARYEKIHLDLTRNTDMREDAVSIDAGDKIIIDNTPSWLPPEPIEALVEGYEETLGLFTWDIVYNASPASPYTVGQSVEDPEDAGPATSDRCDTAGSVLVTDVDETETEFVVRTTQNGYVTSPRWINSDGPGLLHTDEFPFDVRVDGEVVSVEASESFAYDSFNRTVANGWGTAESGQTWTDIAGTASERSVSGGIGSVTIASSTGGSRVQVLESENIGDCDIKCTVSVGETATGGSLIPAIILRHQEGTDYTAYRARVHFLTTGGILLSFWADGTAQVGSAVDTGYTYSPNQKFTLHVRLMGHRMLARLFPADVEFEPLHWQLDETNTSNLLEQGLPGVLAAVGGSNTDALFTFEDFEIWNPQRFTVERSINTVVRAHDSGESVSLDRPAIVGL